jgi:hypothetical protein
MYAQPAPAALNPIELVDYTSLIAAEVAAGRYPYIQYDETERWHQRIYRDRRVDVWLISWLPSQGTQLHDHGGSAGAFTVLSGDLNEAVYLPPRPGNLRRPGADSLREHLRAAGAGVGFGPRYVHDVRNLGSAPAVSVHAYSPPLTSMNFYDIDTCGELVRLATLPTDDPEPTAEVLATAVAPTPSRPARGRPAA